MQHLLSRVDGVKDVAVDYGSGTAALDLARPVALSALNAALAPYGYGVQAR